MPLFTQGDYCSSWRDVYSAKMRVKTEESRRMAAKRKLERQAKITARQKAARESSEKEMWDFRYLESVAKIDDVSPYYDVDEGITLDYGDVVFPRPTFELTIKEWSEDKDKHILILEYLREKMARLEEEQMQYTCMHYWLKWYCAKFP